ncbi:MAG: 4a-hydroxytetrahydrobiopterin dehydratase [Burkholderiaceae bacterium]|nr:MAG: 4a-hydroxytetrahydrobiopterin dehydratase [Burkholderiaceae bacterium]
MRTYAQLLTQHCTPQHGSALAEADITRQLAALPHWQYIQGAVQRAYVFKNYYETLAFVNALAYIVHHEDHHPDLLVTYNRCEVRFNTHSVKGISENDFICAAKTEALYEQHAAAQ